MSNTNTIKKILTSCFVFALASFTIFSSISAQARLPNRTDVFPKIDPDKKTTNIPADKKTPIVVALEYGSLTSDSDIVNAVAKLTLDSTSLTFVNTGFSDYYNGDPNRSDSVNPPAQPSCKLLTSVPKYSISSSLVSSNTITYGLQSARNASAQSGAATVDKLRAKATGCLQITLAVAATAKEDDIVNLTYDEDSLTSNSYAEANRPGIRKINFTIGAPTTPVASSSSAAPVSSAAQSSTPAVVASSATTVSTPRTTTSTVTAAKTQLDRTGGFETITGLGIVAGLILAYIGFKVYKRRINKVDIGGK